ncbi:hypothetical protein C0J52_16876 [Blattella germanica]|nr:hypothetical protein C0J52_16876 [Blattella germanica]
MIRKKFVKDASRLERPKWSIMKNYKLTEKNKIKEQTLPMGRFHYSRSNHDWSTTRRSIGITFGTNVTKERIPKDIPSLDDEEPESSPTGMMVAAANAYVLFSVIVLSCNMADRTHKDLSTRKSLLTLVNTAGYSISQAALSIGIPVSTAHRWYNYLGKGLNTVVQVLEEGVYPLLSRMQLWLQKQSGTHSSLLLLLELILSSLDLLEQLYSV